MTIDLRCGDCLELMCDLPDGSVDAIVTDPPWMDYITGRYDASAWHKPIDRLSPSVYAKGLFRLLRDDRAMILWCRWDSFQCHADALTEVGFTVKNCIVWAKPNHTAGDLEGNLGNKHEMAVFAVKGRWIRNGKREVNLWEESHLFSRARRDHPTEKPVNLILRCIRAITTDGMTIFDPFMGSGTTGVACVQTGRNFIGMEIDPSYFEIAKKRIESAQPPLLQITECD